MEKPQEKPQEKKNDSNGGLQLGQSYRIGDFYGKSDRNGGVQLAKSPDKSISDGDEVQLMGITGISIYITMVK